MSAIVSTKRESSIRRTAENLVLSAIRFCGSAEVRTVLQILPTVEAVFECSISVVERQLPSEVLGFVEATGSSEFQIVISRQCATKQHTLAHELGHVVLGHRHCCLDDIEVPDESYRDLARFLAGAPLDDQVQALEWEAEVFADRLMEMLEDTVSTVQPGAFVWKAALTL